MPDQSKEVPGHVNSSRQPQARKLFPGVKSKSVDTGEKDAMSLKLRITSLMWVGVLTVGLTVMTVGAADHHKDKDIVDTAVAAGSFKTLATALEATGLVETLKGDGPFTVFAPTDDAFAKLPAGTLDALLKDLPKLKGILLYHVVAGKVMAKDVVKLKSAKTVQGSSAKISLRGGKVMIDEANVATTDIMASNGVIHVIDSVIMPN
jgi:uncharacterized surface protein with fasciclin (FAS1) repeats